MARCCTSLRNQSQIFHQLSFNFNRLIFHYLPEVIHTLHELWRPWGLPQGTIKKKLETKFYEIFLKGKKKCHVFWFHADAIVSVHI
jgi:hypothetical protein